jgi:hypothetical protein
MAGPEDDDRGGRREAVPSEAAPVVLKVAGPQRP